MREPGFPSGDLNPFWVGVERSDRSRVSGEVGSIKRAGVGSGRVGLLVDGLGGFTPSCQLGRLQAGLVLGLKGFGEMGWFILMGIGLCCGYIGVFGIVRWALVVSM